MNIHKRFKAQKGYPRLDHFLNESLPDISRSQIVKLIKDNRVTLNDKPISKKNVEIQVDDVVDIQFPQQEKKEYHPSIQLKKLFEDPYLLIIDKPAGIAVHMGAGEPKETILDVFRYNYPQIEQIETGDDVDRPGIVHRLDRDTSGILILAKDTITMKRLQKQFKRRQVKKTYLALVSGHMRFRTGTIDEPIIRSPRTRTKFVVPRPDQHGTENAREAVTHYFVIRQYENFSFVRLKPHTGRTHQLRVHLSHLGNPILGDPIYGKGKGRSFERLALHAYSISFYHPVTEHLLTAFSPFPPLFRDYLKMNLLLLLKETDNKQ